MASFPVQFTVCSASSMILVLHHSSDGGEDLGQIIVAAFQRYYISNPLHPEVFPTIRKMEAEIVSMCLRLYNNPEGAGTMTSGGTESIIMAMKTYRDWAKAVKGITEPEMSVLPGCGGAAEYFLVSFHLPLMLPSTRALRTL